MISRISQSFIKNMRDYKAGLECGNIIKHQYVDGNLIDLQSDSMAEGSYFEFMWTTALPKNKKTPLPVYMKSPLKNKAARDLKVSDMDQGYRRIHFNSGYVKSVFDKLGLKIVSFGKLLVKGRHEGTIDIIALVTKSQEFGDVVWNVGDKIVIDVKYSGLLNDKWSRHGWMWSDIQKEYHGTQAKQYNYVSELPFYFFVVSSTNKEVEGTFEPPEIKFFHVPIDSHMTEVHLSEGNSLLEMLKFESEVGFKPRPEYGKCSKCSIREGCLDRFDFPRPSTVDLTLGL